MTVVDPQTLQEHTIDLCRSCDAVIYWALTVKGKFAPFDVVDNIATTTSHFATCPQAAAWRKR